MEVWKIVFHSILEIFHFILEIFHSIPFWNLSYSIPKFQLHSIPIAYPFHTMPCPWSVCTKQYFCSTAVWSKATFVWAYWLTSRGGVEDTRLEAKTQKKSEAKDRPSENRHSWGQGQECSRPRPRTKDTNASVLHKKRSSKFFPGDLKKKKVFKIFSGDLQKKTV